MYLFLIIFFSYCTNHFQNKLFFQSIIYLSLVFLIIGAYGWLHGGENIDKLGMWGNQFIYFAYRYMPSTRNEDHQIFIYSFLISTYYLFFIKWEKKILIINQLNLIVLFLSFSRGAYVVTTLNILIIITFVFFFYKEKRKKLLIYLIITPIFMFSSIQLINKTVNINLNSAFLVKLESFNYLNDKLDLSNSKDSHAHLLKSSRNSLKMKFEEWSITKKEGLIFKKIKNKKKRYYESSFLYMLNNFNILIVILISYFFLKNIILKFSKFEKESNNFINILILINFMLLNLVYNYLDDIWNYLIAYYIISLFNHKFKITYK